VQLLNYSLTKKKNSWRGQRMQI